MDASEAAGTFAIADVQILVVADAQLPLGLMQIVCKGLFSQWFIRIVLTPTEINAVELAGSCMGVGLKHDISRRFQKIKDVVIRLSDFLHMLLRPLADREFETVSNQPMQSLQTPQQDALRFCLQLLTNVCIVNTTFCFIPNAKYQLATIESV